MGFFFVVFNIWFLYKLVFGVFSLGLVSVEKCWVFSLFSLDLVIIEDIIGRCRYVV